MVWGRMVRSCCCDAPFNTAMVETTASFAVKPVISAAVVFQSLKPRGLKIGEMARLKQARMLLSLFATMLKRTSKVCKTQMIMVAMKITVNAFVIKFMK